MTTLIASLLPLAGCAAMMLLCTRKMRRVDCTTASPAETTDVAQLRAEVAELRARLEPTAQPDEDQLPVR